MVQLSCMFCISCAGVGMLWYVLTAEVQVLLCVHLSSTCVNKSGLLYAATALQAFGCSQYVDCFVSNFPALQL